MIRPLPGVRNLSQLRWSGELAGCSGKGANVQRFLRAWLRLYGESRVRTDRETRSRHTYAKANAAVTMRYRIDEVIAVTEWYERSFGRDYLLVYRHRDFQGATQEVHGMMEWLRLPASASILDLCCGMGRHALALAEAGYRVTGVDLSDVLLEEAMAHDTRGQVKFLRGDMRELPVEGPYDAVVNLFTSFGYFADNADNARVFQEIHRVLKPQGRFIVDFLNPSYVREHLVPHSERLDGGTRIEERRRIENGFVKKEIALTDASGGEPRHYEERVRLYELADFRQMMEEAGLVIDQVHGGYDGAAYDEGQSKRMIMVGHRP